MCGTLYWYLARIINHDYVTNLLSHPIVLVQEWVNKISQ